MTQGGKMAWEAGKEIVRYRDTVSKIHEMNHHQSTGFARLSHREQRKSRHRSLVQV